MYIDNFLRSNFKNRVNSIQNQQSTYELSKSGFQPQICEIKLLPNGLYHFVSSEILTRTHSVLTTSLIIS